MSKASNAMRVDSSDSNTTDTRCLGNQAAADGATSGRIPDTDGRMEVEVPAEDVKIKPDNTREGLSMRSDIITDAHTTTDPENVFRKTIESESQVQASTDYRMYVSLGTGQRDCGQDIDFSIENIHKTYYDISAANNFVIRDHREPLRNGLVLDFDYAMKDAKRTKTSDKERTVTVPFVAIDLLKMESSVKHSAIHDVESLFYTLLCLARLHEGPRGLCRDDSRSKKILYIKDWCLPDGNLSDEKKLSAIATRKALDMKNDYCYKYILDSMDGYFKDLHPYFWSLRSVFFSKEPLLDYGGDDDPNMDYHYAMADLQLSRSSDLDEEAEPREENEAAKVDRSLSKTIREFKLHTLAYSKKIAERKMVRRIIDSYVTGPKEKVVPELPDLLARLCLNMGEEGRRRKQAWMRRLVIAECEDGFYDAPPQPFHHF